MEDNQMRTWRANHQTTAYILRTSGLGFRTQFNCPQRSFLGKGISGLKGERNQKADQNQNSIVTPLGINQLAPLNSHPRWLPASPLSQFS